MRNLAALLVAASLVASNLIACGGTNFTGTYVGDIVRTDVRTNTFTTVTEKWTINDNASKLFRVRDGIPCELTLELGCSMGCFDKVISAGECIFDGELFRLESGLIDSGNLGDNDFQISMSWTAAGAGGARVQAIVESGIMTKQ